MAHRELGAGKARVALGHGLARLGVNLAHEQAALVALRRVRNLYGGGRRGGLHRIGGRVERIARGRTLLAYPVRAGRDRAKRGLAVCVGCCLVHEHGARLVRVQLEHGALKRIARIAAGCGGVCRHLLHLDRPAAGNGKEGLERPDRGVVQACEVVLGAVDARLLVGKGSVVQGICGHARACGCAREVGIALHVVAVEHPHGPLRGRAGAANA